MWMDAGTISRKFSINRQRAYYLARRAGWECRDTWPKTPWVYEWNVPEDCGDQVRDWVASLARRRYENGHMDMRCRHGNEQGRCCEAVAEAVVQLALDEPVVMGIAGVPAWVFR